MPGDPAADRPHSSGSAGERAGAPLLRAECVGFAVGSRSLVADVSLEIRAGECVALLGPNGSGKTTLLRLLTGVRRPTSGRVLLEGRELGSYSRPEIACRMAYLPQGLSVEFDVTVADVVLMGRYPHLGAWRSMTPADRDAVRGAMRRADVEHLARRALPTLSAGERQRVFLARALAQGSPLLVLDEPTTSLDVGHQLELVEILSEVHAEGKTIVAAVHDLRLAWERFPRAILLGGGRLRDEGLSREVIAGHAAREAFGVRDEIGAAAELRFTRAQAGSRAARSPLAPSSLDRP